MGSHLARGLPEASKSAHGGAALAGHSRFGVCSVRGCRQETEGAHLALPDFDEERKLGLFGVFEGHRGCASAQAAAEMLPIILRAQLAFKEGRYADALREAFLQLKAFVMSTRQKEVTRFRRTNRHCGLVALLCGGGGGECPEVIVAKANDAGRCILARGSEALDVSEDQHPGFMGVLAGFSTAGDSVATRHVGKTAEEKGSGKVVIYDQNLMDGDTHLLLGCGNIFDKVTNQQLVSFIQAQLMPNLLRQETRRLSDVCMEFLEKNVIEDQSTGLSRGCDGSTLMLVDLAGLGRPHASMQVAELLC